MNKYDLIKKISENTDSLNEEDLEQTVNIILKLISNSLNNGDRVEIRNFGTFSVRSRDQRISRNPKTGTSVLVEPKNHPYFRASKYLKESLNK
jgi:integration host factor subunit beta